MYSFTIKDLENLSGVKAHTIRMWEQRYSFLKPSRTGTNIRYYTNEELKRFLNIALLTRYGYKISHIDKMEDIEIRERILSLDPSPAEEERIINELIHHMVDLSMDKFETVLDNYIRVKKIGVAIPQVVFPFLKKIGILWLTNHINPAQEHLVSNIIRQKLIMGIENISAKATSRKTVLLFLPEGEYHELGLLFMHYIFKSKGIGVLYLGCSIPLADLEYVVKCKQPDYIYSHLTTVGNKFNFDKFLLLICRSCPDIPIVISGQLAHKYEKKVAAPIHFKKSFPDVMDFVSTI